MKIGVLSDTHIPYSTKNLPEKVLEILHGTDAILHCGDFQALTVVETLSSITEFYGVYGNMDPAEIRRLLPEKRVINLAGAKLGLIHGSGPPAGIEDRVMHSFYDEEVDIIVFGHSHSPMNKTTKEGILLFNPGSPTDKRFAESNSMGILTIGEKITAEIITV